MSCFRTERPPKRKDSVWINGEFEGASSKPSMGNISRKAVKSNSEQKVKGYGLFVYGGMTMGAGVLLAERNPAFFVISALGLLAVIVGLYTIIKRAWQAWTIRQRVRDNRM